MVSHLAESARASIACWARADVGAATPTKSPSRTTTTPSISFASPRSTPTSLAPKDGRRRILPWSIPRPGDVGRIVMAAGDDVAGVGAGRRGAQHVPLRHRRQFDVAWDRGGEHLRGVGVVGEVGVAQDPIRGPIDRLAVLDRDRFGVDAPPSGGQLRQHLASGGAASADRRDGRRGRHAAIGPAVVGDESGVGHDQADPVGLDAEFLGGGLGQLGPRALAALDLAGHHGQRAVLAEVDPGRQVRRPPAATAGLLLGGNSRLLLAFGRLDRDGDHQPGAEDLEEAPAGGFGVKVERDEVDLLLVILAEPGDLTEAERGAVVSGPDHRRPSWPDARRTASRILG